MITENILKSHAEKMAHHFFYIIQKYYAKSVHRNILAAQNCQYTLILIENPGPKPKYRETAEDIWKSHTEKTAY